MSYRGQARPRPGKGFPQADPGVHPISSSLGHSGIGRQASSAYESPLYLQRKWRILNMCNAIDYTRVKGLASQTDAIGRLLGGYRNPRRIRMAVLRLLIVGAALSLTILVVQPSPVRAQTIPTNASGGCPVPAATFNGWFQSAPPSVNGVVNPANSLTFAPSSLCSFYQWSEQMFLWLLSPAPASYGGGPHIFHFPAFFEGFAL